MSTTNTRQEEDQSEMHQRMIKYKIEPEICKHFGCGKHLTPEESRHGDYCMQHLGKKKIDIMNVFKDK